MKFFLRMITIRPACLALFVLLTSTEGLSQNGKLIDSAVVNPTDAELKRFGPSEQRIRAILEQVELRKITYLSDGLRVKAYLSFPKKGERLPCVIFNRGGNREFGALDDARAAGTLGSVASWGYIVVASQYRGNAGGEGKEEFGGRDVNDVLNLIPLLESLPQADATRIGMYGWSRGGMMTYLALARSDRIAAAVVGAGAADLFDGAKRRPEMETEVYAQLIPDFHKNKERELTMRSAVRWPEKLHKKTPILLLHGSADWRVHPTEGLAMATALYNSKHPFRFVFFEGGDHGLTEHRVEVNRLIKDWLDNYVRDRKTWPSLEPHGQ
ncbi:MAG TPA: prolyl oligopeptidase family serine peptidase [Blastocatellia bacterium]|nr:prolyl oligopeptidase family serine peptidase [Blastocatellia bacterium]